VKRCTFRDYFCRYCTAKNLCGSL